MNLCGTGVAIVTPFTPQHTIDFAGLEKLVNHLLEGKVEYIVVLGTTGESATLSKSEKAEVLQFIRKQVGTKCSLVAGIGGNHTQEVLENFKGLPLDGYQAILSVSPYYNKPNQEGIYQHYKTLAEHTPLPIILYNVPGRTGSNITAHTALRLAKDFKNIIAIKEASGNLEQVMQIIHSKPEHFSVISGDDALTLPMIASGASGVISVVANAYPFEFSEMVRKALAMDYTEAQRLHYKVFDLIQLLFADGNPGGIKETLQHMGIIYNEMRQPLYPVNKTLSTQISSFINNFRN